ncbi:MAG: Gfo/Idh/MocA family oxidoreductase [Bacteroidales bacterium]|jgi:hypothetical protein|nr:Gfo/Idh/MocA family oxidoreductase [Bacteroidales bacterium]
MIRIGIIGTDESAHRHTTVLLANNAFDITGNYDCNNRDSMLFARQYRIISYSSLEALFKYSEAIDIASNLPDVFTLAEKSLKTLKHVYIAYPHALTADQLQYLLKLADESEVTLRLGTKHNSCPVCNFADQTGKTPQTVHIRHLLNRKGQHPFNRLKSELPYDLSLALGMLKSNIIKIDPQVEMADATFRCRMECDNGGLLTVTVHITEEETEKLTLRLTCPGMEMEADVFQSVANIYYNELDVTDHKLLEPYNERSICKNQLNDFADAVQRQQNTALSMDLHMQCFIAADIAIDCAHQTAVAKTLSDSYQGFSHGE